MAPTTAIAAGPGGPGRCSGTAGSCEGGDEIRLDVVEASIEYFGPWHDHDVETSRRAMTAKHLSGQTFRAITCHRVADSASGRHAETWSLTAVLHQKNGHESRVEPAPLVVGALKICSAPHSGGPWKALLSHALASTSQPASSS